MTLREHITELRNRLLKSVLAIVLGTVLGWFFYNQALDFLKAPFETSVSDLAAAKGLKPVLTFTGVGDALTFRIKISAVLGLVLASPIWLYQLWAFIAPGLHRSERRWAMLFSAIATPLFVGGMGVAYWTLPTGLQILIGFTPLDIQNLITLPAYLDFVIRTMLVFGIAFLIPLVVILLKVTTAIITSIVSLSYALGSRSSAKASSQLHGPVRFGGQVALGISLCARWAHRIPAWLRVCWLLMRSQGVSERPLGYLFCETRRGPSRGNGPGPRRSECRCGRPSVARKATVWSDGAGSRPPLRPARMLR